MRSLSSQGRKPAINPARHGGIPSQTAPLSSRFSAAQPPRGVS